MHRLRTLTRDIGRQYEFHFPTLTDESFVSSKALFRTLNRDSSVRGPFLWQTCGLPPVPSRPLDQNTQLQARTPVATRVSSEQSPHDNHLSSVSSVSSSTFLYSNLFHLSYCFQTTLPEEAEKNKETHPMYSCT